MEIFIENMGLSHIADNIFANLDVQSLLNCRSVNSTWKAYIDTTKYFWKNFIYRFNNLNCEQGKNCVASWKYLISKQSYSIEELKVFIGFLLKIERVHRESENLYYDSCQFNYFEIACKYGDPKILSILLRSQMINVADKNGILVASQHNNSKNVQFLMENCGSIDLNARNYDGSTALHYTCADGNLDIVKSLIKKGIRLNATNYDGRNALHEACHHGHAHIVDLLISSKINVNAMDNNERTALHDACENPNIEVVKLLVDKGSNVNADDVDGLTPLHEACTNGHLDIVQFLLENGADVNALSFEENTCLHFACEEGRLDIVEYLLKIPFLKANGNNELGETPMNLAMQNNHTKVLELLSKHCLSKLFAPRIEIKFID